MMGESVAKNFDFDFDAFNVSYLERKKEKKKKRFRDLKEPVWEQNCEKNR